MVQGGTKILKWAHPPPTLAFFCFLQYFEKILPLVQTLWCALQDEVYTCIKICGTAGGLSLHPRWWLPSWILPKTRSYQKQLKLTLFDAWHVEYDMIKHFDSFWQILCFYHLKKVKTHVFSQKMAWPPATYDVMSGNHSNQYWSNLCQNVSKECA